MVSKVISFRVPDVLYEEFERRCRDEDMRTTTKLREFVESICHTSEEAVLEDAARVKVINVGADKVDKVIAMDSKRKAWFPFDFSPLFRKD